MPRIVRAFACEFRCGFRVTTDRNQVERHEETCMMNPASRACKACKHNRWVKFEADTGAGNHGECKIDKLPNGKTCTRDCPSWEPKR